MTKLQLPSFTRISLNYEQRYDHFGEYDKHWMIHGKHQKKLWRLANEQVPGARARIGRAQCPKKKRKQKHIGKQTYNDNARVDGGESSMKPLSALRVESVENSTWNCGTNLPIAHLNNNKVRPPQTWHDKFLFDRVGKTIWLATPPVVAGSSLPSTIYILNIIIYIYVYNIFLYIYFFVYMCIYIYYIKFK
jgi:hypothetical protein